LMFYLLFNLKVFDAKILKFIGLHLENQPLKIIYNENLQIALKLFLS